MIIISQPSRFFLLTIKHSAYEGGYQFKYSPKYLIKTFTVAAFIYKSANQKKQRVMDYEKRLEELGWIDVKKHTPPMGEELNVMRLTGWVHQETWSQTFKTPSEVRESGITHWTRSESNDRAKFETMTQKQRQDQLNEAWCKYMGKCSTEILQALAFALRWADAHPVVKVGGALKNYERGYEDAIDKACEWLEKKACLYVWMNCEQGEHGIHKTMLEDLRKAMEGE